MNDDSPEATQELSAVLEDVRRHLLWQEDGGGRMLMIDAKAAAELQRLTPSLRSRFARPGPATEPAPAERRPAPATSTAPTTPVSRPVDAAPGPGTSRVDRPVGAAPGNATPAPSGRPLAPPEPATHAPIAARATPRPTAPTSNGMLLDVPKSSPTGSGALPGVVDGERPTLDQVRRELGDCQRCKLCTGRKNIVFGSGNPRAELVFVGEGPGENEDIQGFPFVGAAGDLLTKMIEAMGFRRDDVYICNVVKCRPPGNRNPEPDEIAACEPFLRAQLAALQPKVVVALGKFAAQTLLRDSTPITRMRGAWRVYEGIQLMPTFHPAYLLRNPAEKRKAWEDLQAVMKIFGKNPGSRA
ncbi:uracil-DNA glycosylase [Myxococcus sp. K38C18041901]|uniref:uracil-DNA glycosylase n=1 Tax=Myxococcus guangdongensis TaxID=2906760 RepID=UPI0020A6EA8F|nr:uracil-DNA glycosylase family protein [Myxococcus guangdongensis]MCP3065199.1 uracil-DNA glycosylase [Myxococcus guangdongensis]